MSEPATSNAQPASILAAVKVMYAGAVASAVFAVLGFTQRGVVRDALAKDNATRPPNKRYTDQQLDSFTSNSITFSVVLGLICVLLWVWMARANRRGRSWARTISTVLAGLGVLSFVFSVASAGSIIGKVIGAIVAALGVIAVYLLWRPDSRQFYDEQTQARADVGGGLTQ